MKSGLLLRARVVSTALLAAPVSLVWAHPGHEHPVTPPGSPLHMLIEPEHVIQVLALAGIAMVSYKVGQCLHATFARLTLHRQKARR